MSDEEPQEHQRDGGWTTAPGKALYSNSMGVAGGPFDVTLIFGQQDNTKRTPQTPAPDSEELVRVSMSWAHLKSMIPLLARVVAEYEQQAGEVPSPGFDQNWRA